MLKKLKLTLITLSLMAIFAAITYASPPAVNSVNNIAEITGTPPSVSLVITEMQSDNTAIIAEAPTIAVNENQKEAAATTSNITNPALDSNNINEAAIKAQQNSASLTVSARGTNKKTVN